MGQELRSPSSLWPTPGLCCYQEACQLLADWVFAGLSFSTTGCHIWKAGFSWSQWTLRAGWKYNAFCELILEVPHNFFCYILLFLRRKALSPALTQWEGLFFFFLTNYWIKKKLFIWLRWILVALWSIFCCSVQTQVVVPGLRSFNAYLFWGMWNPTSPVRDWTPVTCTAKWILVFFLFIF